MATPDWVDAPLQLRSRKVAKNMPKMEEEIPDSNNDQLSLEMEIEILEALQDILMDQECSQLS